MARARVGLVWFTRLGFTHGTLLPGGQPTHFHFPAANKDHESTLHTWLALDPTRCVSDPRDDSLADTAHNCRQMRQEFEHGFCCVPTGYRQEQGSVEDGAEN